MQQTSMQGSSGGAGMGSSWSWIGDIFKVVGGTSVTAMQMDQANRAYKYNVWERLPVESNKNTLYLLIGGSIILVLLLFVFMGLNKNKS